MFLLEGIGVKSILLIFRFQLIAKGCACER